ncbi:class III lanthionine synthetase LanKC [Nocardiopsis suaedae]|uniref:Class III lanthionine synthetase LanKC n=1 Tax=Nocardiopsis suaedae TaxID=3018444 RepID=A0ABT4TPH6_9ACTN|nr:class III lanthionine synthetase LanKC [Nocardiopsis suaedae]MDA2806285.1 class III lanthionine synthetase LanKC [Nocardiopsis suaedae]
MERFYFTFADPDFYDDIGRWRCDPGDPRFTRVRKGPVPLPYAEGWTRSGTGIWTLCRPEDRPLPDQGWKLHIAVTPDTFEPLLHTVADVCRRWRAPFKFLSRYEYAWLVNAKYAARSGSGKGIAVYPADEHESVALAAELAERTRGTEGPRILSDARVGDTVVHARYGAFVRRYCRDERGRVRQAMTGGDGRPVPDPRTVPFKAPDFVSVPSLFRPPPRSRDGGDRLPYRIDKALHFSNGGGVYLASEGASGSGRRVVLKEARPYAGLDLVGGDAVRRAAREYEALRALSGLPGFPEVYDRFTWQSHVFTSMEYIRGTTLQEWSAANHPYLLRPDPFAPPAPAEAKDYRERIEAVLEQVAQAVEAAWEHGYAIGDLHPGNIMVSPEGEATLIDLEACVPLGEHRPFPGAPGFSDVRRQGRDGDEYGLRLLELSCYLPLTPLLRLDPAKLTPFLAAAREMFDLSAEWAERIRRTFVGTGTPDAAPAPDPVPATTGRAAGAPPAASGHLDGALGFEGWAGQVVEGFRASMSEERTDRLFPCDPTGFSLSPVSLATGSAGVLWSLLGTDGVYEPGLVRRIAEWTLANARGATDRPHCGLYDSELGAGYALWRAGWPDHARWCVDAALAKDRSGCGSGVFGGTAGIFLAVAAMAGGPDPIVERAEAERIGAELADRAHGLAARPHSSDGGPGAAHGLMHGLAGIGLAAHRYGVLADDPSAVDTARELVERELAAYVRCTDGSLQYNEQGRRTLAYLEEGSCGTALAVAELGRRDGWRPRGASVPDLMRALGPELMVQAGLFRGRAGFLAGLAQLARDGHGASADPLVRRHADRLGLHELRPNGRGLHYPGSGNFRISGDLRTGGAGVLTGVAFATGRRDDWLPGLF